MLDSAAIAANVPRIRDEIARACLRAGRDPGAVRLVAASKTVPPAAISAAHAAGVGEFGENYVRELRDKRSVAPDARWHFIGTLQSHTARHVADLADVVQTLAPGSAVGRLGRRAAASGKRLPALIEVDFTGGRSGVAPERCESFADEVAATEGLALAGLMTIPPLSDSAEDARPYFERLRELGSVVARSHAEATELSMGMSLDYQVAVEEGATIVRIGTALFGQRPPV